MTSKDELIKAIGTAQGAWDGADWTHEKRDAEGHIVTEANEQGDDITVYCEGGDDDCKTCCDAARDASGASECGNEAIAAIRKGDMDEAASQINRASDIESEYGDDPTWGPVVKMIDAMTAKSTVEM